MKNIDEITSLAISFITKEWNNLKSETELHNIYQTKDKLISTINDSYILACYIVSEIMQWGTSTNHLKPFIKSTLPFIIQINNKNFLLDDIYFVENNIINETNETIEFASYLSGHSKATIEQMYNDWKKTKRSP